MNANQAPGERWFRFTVPAKSIGNQFKIEIENLGDPHYVDLSVNFCRTNEMDLSEMGCQAKDDMYYGDDQTLHFIPSSQKNIGYMSSHGTKEGRPKQEGLDKGTCSNFGDVDSNADREEPEMIQEGDKLKEKSETGCTTGDLDPVDVFYIEGFAGDEVTIKFGSRENDFLVTVCECTTTTKFTTSTILVPLAISLDDWYHDNNPGTNNEGISTLTYTFDIRVVVHMVHGSAR